MLQIDSSESASLSIPIPILRLNNLFSSSWAGNQNANSKNTPAIKSFYDSIMLRAPIVNNTTPAVVERFRNNRFIAFQSDLMRDEK
jgi:hypothetical protein